MAGSRAGVKTLPPSISGAREVRTTRCEDVRSRLLRLQGDHRVRSEVELVAKGQVLGSPEGPVSYGSPRQVVAGRQCCHSWPRQRPCAKGRTIAMLDPLSGEAGRDHVGQGLTPVLCWVTAGSGKNLHSAPPQSPCSSNRRRSEQPHHSAKQLLPHEQTEVWQPHMGALHELIMLQRSMMQAPQWYTSWDCGSRGWGSWIAGISPRLLPVGRVEMLVSASKNKQLPRGGTTHHPLPVHLGGLYLLQAPQLQLVEDSGCLQLYLDHMLSRDPQEDPVRLRVPVTFNLAY